MKILELQELKQKQLKKRKLGKKLIRDKRKDQRNKKKELKEVFKSEEKILLTAMKAQPIKRSILHMT